MQKPIATESQEQQALFQWAGLLSSQYPELGYMYHVKNEGKLSDAGRCRAAAEGLKSGVPDIHLPVARGKYHGLYIEMKRRQGGTLTLNQTRWITFLREEGYRVIVSYGWDEASNEILSYLELPKPDR